MEEFELFARKRIFEGPHDEDVRSLKQCLLDSLEEDRKNEFMVYQEGNTEFDYNSLLKNPNIKTVSGIPVKIDRLFRDLTGETVVAVSGVLIAQGVKIRAVWNLSGEIFEYKRMRSFLLPKNNWKCAFEGNEDMLNIVMVEEINNEHESNHREISDGNPIQ